MVVAYTPLAFLLTMVDTYQPRNEHEWQGHQRGCTIQGGRGALERNYIPVWDILDLQKVEESVRNENDGLIRKTFHPVDFSEENLEMKETLLFDI